VSDASINVVPMTIQTSDGGSRWNRMETPRRLWALRLHTTTVALVATRVLTTVCGQNVRRLSWVRREGCEVAIGSLSTCNLFRITPRPK
jgi:hypothetical protein